MKTTKNDSEKLTLEQIRKVALRMIARRDFFIPELKKKLEDKHPYNTKEIETIIHEFIKSTWLDDNRTIPEFIRTKSEYSGWGPYKISQKLAEKGINRPQITEQIEKFFSQEKQIELAEQLAQDKWRFLYKKKATERTAAVQRFLVSRGFNYDVIISATKSLSDL